MLVWPKSGALFCFLLLESTIAVRPIMIISRSLSTVGISLRTIISRGMPLDIRLMRVAWLLLSDCNMP